MSSRVYKLKTSFSPNTQEVQDRLNLRAVERRYDMKVTTTRIKLYLEYLASMLQSRHLKNILKG